MTDLDFLAAICERPDDDLPRLVYADCLQDRDEHERAEFIRVQVELAKELAHLQPHHHDNLDMVLDPQDHEQQAWKHSVHALRKREQYLLDRHGRDWTPEPVYRACGYEPRSWPFSQPWVFQRGFVSRITLSADDWLAHHADLCWPWGECGWCENGVQRFCNEVDGEYTEECPWCSGRGRVGPMDECPEHGIYPAQEVCGTCKTKTGRVPRPFRGTEQPLTDVTLTDWPTFAAWLELRNRVKVDGAGNATATDPRFLGICFHLPSSSTSA